MHAVYRQQMFNKTVDDLINVGCGVHLQMQNMHTHTTRSFSFSKAQIQQFYVPVHQKIVY